MVTPSRTALGAGDVRRVVRPAAVGRQRADLRPLNAPSPLRVRTDARGRIVSVWRHGRPIPRAVVAVQDRWRIDDEWWREHAVSRMYYAVVLDDGAFVTLYHDLTTDAWFEQRC